jgi:hypothetical protein
MDSSDMLEEDVRLVLAGSEVCVEVEPARRRKETSERGR